MLPTLLAAAAAAAAAAAFGCCRHITPLLQLVKPLNLDAAVYIPPLLTALQQSSLQSLTFEVLQRAAAAAV